MGRSHRKTLLTLLCGLLLLYSRSQAQEYIFNRLDTKDGLASTFTYAVWQDKKGFLWIGTENGLQRYDGYHFMEPYNPGPRMLPQKAVHQILEDKRGRLWIRMQYDIYLFDPETLYARRIPIHNSGPFLYGTEMSLHTDNNGNVYTIFAFHGWYRYSDSTDAFEENNLPFRLPAAYKITRIWEDAPSQLLWICTNRGLLAYDNRKKELYSPAYNPLHHPLLQDSTRFKNLLHFFIDSKRRFWIYTWDKYQQYFCYDEKQHRFVADTAGLSQIGRGFYYELKGITELSNGTMVTYGSECLAMNDMGRFETLHDDYVSSYSIEFTTIYQVFEDREKIVWLATDNGLYNTMAVTNASRHLILSKNKHHGSITSVFEMPNKDIWLGTWSAGIIKRTADLWSESSLHLDETSQKDGNYKLNWSFCRQGHTDNVWIGCQLGRLIYYRPQHPVYLHPAPMNGNTIRSIIEDRQGNTWFGTQHGTVFRLARGSTLADSSFKKVFELGSTAGKMRIDNQGQLWICTFGKGIAIVDTENRRILKTLTRSPAFDLSSDFINDALQINDSIYCIASDNLNILNSRTGKLKHIVNWKNIPLGDVLTLEKDAMGQLWFSTGNGIFRYCFVTDNLIRYNQWDGLVTVSNNDYITNASCQLQNGQLAFGGNQNLVIFDPARFSVPGHPPDVTISSFRLFNQFIPVDSLQKLPRITLERDQHSLTIEFASLSFRQLDKLVYYYKLEGADQTWNRTEHQLLARYNLLPPGHYTFLVRSQNTEGAFSKHITRLNIYINPPFWQRAWFITLVIIGILLAAYSLHRFRINKLLQVEKVRLRLARDLHDDMGSTLSTIHILSNMAIRKIDTEPAVTRDYIGKINANSSRIMEAMDDIVWSINPLNDSMKKILARMKEFAGNVLEPKDINYSFQIEEAVKDLSFNMEWRREIFLLFKEAINNIAKYAQCRQVNISLVLKNRFLVLRVEDDGVGFDPARQVGENRGNGLKNMQKRTETMNGRFSISSCQGKGTCVEVRIPVT